MKSFNMAMNGIISFTLYNKIDKMLDYYNRELITSLYYDFDKIEKAPF